MRSLLYVLLLAHPLADNWHSPQPPVGVALKAEAMGLAVMLEMPLVICNIQRAGPSTGLPTKTEQADLLQALYGRNGECPMPVIAACTLSDAFMAAFEACRIAIQHMTPVMFLSDGYIANGAEPGNSCRRKTCREIPVTFAPAIEEGDLSAIRTQ